MTVFKGEEIFKREEVFIVCKATNELITKKVKIEKNGSHIEHCKYFLQEKIEELSSYDKAVQFIIESPLEDLSIQKVFRLKKEVVSE